MDGIGIVWYLSGMALSSQIPVFNLFGETSAFPDIIHCESIWDRARLHDWTISPHRHHEMAQVFFMRRGTGTVRIDGRQQVFNDGDFIFIPAGIVHGFAFAQGSDGLVLSFPSNVVRATAGEPALTRQLAHPFAGRTNAAAVALLDRIAEAFPQSGTFRASLLIALAQALFATIAAISERSAQKTEPLDQRRMSLLDQIIATHLSDGWGVSDYASALSITAGHLNRICRAATGENASRHIETAVMTEANRLLAFTQLSVAEIGYRLGFSDPSYFSRRFRALRGQSPSDYRKTFAA